MLAPIAPVLRRADVAMVNLETAVTDRGAPAAKAFTFRAPASAFSALAAGGVDVVNVANNHGMDFGPTGLRDTLAAGKRAGMPIVGAGWNETQAYAPHRVEVNGQRIAIIGATQVLDDHLVTEWTAGPRKLGLASAKDEPRLLRAVREARRTSDTVVVFLHWGLELATCPTGAQTSLARALVGAGADIVVGSHAHVLLGAGRMNRALVAYGLGNFVFYAFRELHGADGRARGDGHGTPDRRVPVGAGSHLRRHPVSAGGKRPLAGARALALAPRVHGPPTLTARRRAAAAEVRPGVAYRSRTGPVLPSPSATRSRILRRARRRLPRRRDGRGRRGAASRDLRRRLGARVDLVRPGRPGRCSGGA